MKKKSFVGLVIIVISVLAVILIIENLSIFLSPFEGCITTADTPAPSRKLESMLQDEGYELVNIATYHHKFCAWGPSSGPEWGPSGPEWGRRPIGPVVENPNPTRVYHFEGQGSIAHFLWLVGELCSIEYKAYPKTNDFVIYGPASFGSFPPVWIRVVWEPDDRPSSYISISYERGSSYRPYEYRRMMNLEKGIPTIKTIPYPVYINAESVLNRELSSSPKINKSEAQALAIVIAEDMIPRCNIKIKRGGTTGIRTTGISYRSITPDDVEYTWIKHGASMSKLVSWDINTSRNCLEIWYSTPVDLKLCLLDSKGNYVDHCCVKGNLLGERAKGILEKGILEKEKSLRGTYKLEVRQLQTNEIIRTHNLSLK
jgi:hypothetical protein